MLYDTMILFTEIYSFIHSLFFPFIFSRGSTRSAAQPEDTSYAAASTPTYPRLTHQLRMHTMEKTNIIKSYYFWIVIFSIFVLSMYTIYFWHWSVRIKKKLPVAYNAGGTKSKKIPNSRISPENKLNFKWMPT